MVIEKRKRRTLEDLKILLIGKQFNRVKVIALKGKEGSHWKWECLCDCGTTFKATHIPLLSGRTKSCGCFTRDRLTTHGMTSSREYSSYRAMRKRCYDKNNKDFHNYGGRGIKVCARWVESFESFLEDMGPRPKGTSLDKIDNEHDYSPLNCRWASDNEQAINRRSTINFELYGKMGTMQDHCRDHGTCSKTVKDKLATGLSFKEAFELILENRRNNIKPFLKTKSVGIIEMR